MDQYPYLSKWLYEEAQGATALLGLVFMVGVALAGYVYLARYQPLLLPSVRRWAFNLFCVLSIIFMLALR